MAAFGTRMKQERERHGVSLDEIALATKISTRFLRAIEDEHFDQLPGGIFNKGFIRAYARHLGIDEDQAITDYLDATGSGPAKASENAAPPFAPKAAREDLGNSEAGLPWGTFAAALLIVALGFSLWGFYSRQRFARPQPATSAKTASPAASNPAETPGSAPAPQLAAAGAAATVSNSTITPGTFTVSVQFREDSWVSITADGEEVLHDTIIAGTSRSFSAGRELVIKAGNVGGLDFEFNGKKLPPQGDEDEVKTLTFDAHGLQPSVPQAQPAAIAKPQSPQPRPPQPQP